MERKTAVFVLSGGLINGTTLGMCSVTLANLDIFRPKVYMFAMAKHHAALIVPKDFPELGMLVWNRDAARAIEREEAFELYERNWRHVDAEHLTPAEAQLIEALTQEFGHGHLLVA